MANNASLMVQTPDGWRRAATANAESTLKIGSDKGCGFTIDGHGCSPVQLVLEHDRRGWKIRDVGQDRITRVRGNRINGWHRLEDGDVIVVGGCVILFVVTACVPNKEEPSVGSVTCCIKELSKPGERTEAQRKLWNRYYCRLIQRARGKFGSWPKRIGDEEDVVSQAFLQFFQGVESSKFPKLDSRNELWAILATIVVRLVCLQISRETARKRSVEHGNGQLGLGQLPHDAVIGMPNRMPRPTPLEDVEYRELVTQLFATLPDDLCEVVELRLLGFSNLEIAEQLTLSLRTVERRMNWVRNRCKSGLLRQRENG